MRSKKVVLLCVLVTLLLITGLCGCVVVEVKPPDENPADRSVDLSECTIECTPNTVTYDGEEKKVALNVKSKSGEFLTKYDPEKTHEFLEVTYSNNIDAGAAAVTVRAKAGTTAYSGQATGTFTIKPAAAEVFDEETLRARLGDKNHDSVTLKGAVRTDAALTVPQGVTLTVAEDSRLLCGGDLTVDGRVRLFDFGTDAFDVAGALIVNGKLSLSGYVLISGNVCNNGTIDCYKSEECKLYTNTQASGTGAYEKVVLVCRRDLADCGTALEFEKTDYTGKQICPQVAVKVDGNLVSESEYSLQYADNVNAGEASVTVTAKFLSETLCGKITLPFTVSPAEKKIIRNSELLRALDDSNYDRFLAGDDAELLSNFTLPAGKTLTVDGAKSGKAIESAAIEGTLILNDSIVYLNKEFSAAGRVINNGTLFITAQAAAKTTVENNGVVYINDDIAGQFEITGTAATLRTPLSNENVRLASERGDYTGEAHRAEPVFEYEDEPTPYVQYRYESYETLRNEAIDAGKVYVHVTANISSPRYYGTAVSEYRIDPIAAAVHNLSDLLDKIRPNQSTGTVSNYSPVTVDFDCTLPADFELASRCELIVAENRSLTYTDRMTIRSGNQLTVNGNFYQGGGTAGLYIDGAFENNGSAYFNGSIPEKVSGAGGNYARGNINLAGASNFPQTVVYDGSEQATRPTVDLIYEGAALAGEHYTVRYANASFVTDREPARAEIAANATSTAVYGTKTLTYKILAGACSVSAYDELKEKTSSVRPGTELCNWEKITVTADLTVQCDKRTEFPKIQVHPNTTVRFGHYSLKATGTYSANFGFTNNGSVVMECKTVDGKFRAGGPSAARCTAESKGRYIGYADSLNAFTDLSRRCNEVYLTADIDNSSTMAGIVVYSVVDLKSKGSLVIDLQGHLLKTYILQLYLTHGAITIKNGTCIARSQFQVNNTAENRKLTFSNVVGPDDGNFAFTNADKSHVAGVTFS